MITVDFVSRDVTDLHLRAHFVFTGRGEEHIATIVNVTGSMAESVQFDAAGFEDISFDGALEDAFTQLSAFDRKFQAYRVTGVGAFAPLLA